MRKYCRANAGNCSKHRMEVEVMKNGEKYENTKDKSILLLRDFLIFCGKQPTCEDCPLSKEFCITEWIHTEVEED